MGRRPLEVEKITPVKVIAETVGLLDFNSGELTALQDLDTDVSVTALSSEGPMFRRFYVQKVLCSEGSIFRRFYVQKVLYSEGSMFRRSYVQKYLFRRFYV